ncbi:MAG: quinone-interacting membrane-bound oxidoreductase complex subunit QmoC [Archaeoglobaceae archaeon]
MIDTRFAKEIIQAGGTSLKKCYQCATCGVVCPQSPNENPFPRKEMIWAQWGAKERLMNDADVWLCHQCNDCSDYCPRGAKPGEVLAAIRAKVVEHYAFPSFLAKILRRPAGILLYFAIPIFFTALYLAIFSPEIPEGEIVLGKFIPHAHVELAGFAVGAWVLFVAAIAAYRFWTAINSQVSKVYEFEVKEGGDIKVVKASARFIEYLFWSIIDILKHSKFQQCNKAKYRFYAHFMIFWGFIVLGVATLGDIVYLYVLGYEELALPITDPVKILGNIGALLLLVGSVWAIVARFGDERIGYGTYFDWLFLATIFAIGVSGVTIEILRYSGSVLAYYAYLAHLILVFTLLAYAPYSKFAHLLYRTLAYVWAKSVGREVKP